ncbi:hypothetical protein HPB48_018430 [Haemaphysalis longicornis]|uniref:Uncharacterized protein n=1 Tax=Haemaphysalis longicornis TaxID=44386 RepID=A0A9J6GF34_HAELO|nr:hypothetical protein HPB48_018430 [Haemaphysalis longicornis]
MPTRGFSAARSTAHPRESSGTHDRGRGGGGGGGAALESKEKGVRAASSPAAAAGSDGHVGTARTTDGRQQRSLCSSSSRTQRAQNDVLGSRSHSSTMMLCRSTVRGKRPRLKGAPMLVEPVTVRPAAGATPRQPRSPWLPLLAGTRGRWRCATRGLQARRTPEQQGKGGHNHGSQQRFARNGSSRRRPIVGAVSRNERAAF